MGAWQGISDEPKANSVSDRVCSIRSYSKVMDKEAARHLRESIQSCFISANEADSNFEAANVVDGLFAIARSINRLAIALETRNSLLLDQDP